MINRFPLEFLSWVSWLENLVPQKLFFFKIHFKACYDFKAINKILSHLGWMLSKTWLSVCQRYQIPSNDSEESFFLNKFAFFLSIVYVDWPNSSDSFPRQAEFWVTVVFGYICSQYQAWSHVFLSPTYKPGWILRMAVGAKSMAMEE